VCNVSVSHMDEREARGEQGGAQPSGVSKQYVCLYEGTTSAGQCVVCTRVYTLGKRRTARQTETATQPSPAQPSPPH